MAIHLKAVWPAQSIVGSRFEPLLARLAGVLSEHRNVLDVPTKPSAAIYPFHLMKYVAELSNKYSYSYSYRDVSPVAMFLFESRSGNLA